MQVQINVRNKVRKIGLGGRLGARRGSSAQINGQSVEKSASDLGEKKRPIRRLELPRRRFFEIVFLDLP